MKKLTNRIRKRGIKGSRQIINQTEPISWPIKEHGSDYRRAPMTRGWVEDGRVWVTLTIRLTDRKQEVHTGNITERHALNHKTKWWKLKIITMLLPENQTVQSEGEQLSHLQQRWRTTGEEQTEGGGGGEEDSPQTPRGRAALRDTSSVNAPYITSHHSPTFTHRTGGRKHLWTKHFTVADITPSSSCTYTHTHTRCYSSGVGLQSRTVDFGLTEVPRRRALFSSVTQPDGPGWWVQVTNDDWIDVNRESNSKKKKKPSRGALRSLTLMTARCRKQDDATFEAPRWKEM